MKSFISICSSRGETYKLPGEIQPALRERVKTLFCPSGKCMRFLFLQIKRSSFPGWEKDFESNEPTSALSDGLIFLIFVCTFPLWKEDVHSCGVWSAVVGFCVEIGHKLHKPKMCEASLLQITWALCNRHKIYIHITKTNILMLTRPVECYNEENADYES